MGIAIAAVLAQPPVPTYDIADLTGAQITQLQDKLSLRLLSGGVDFFGSAPELADTSLAGFAWHPEVDEMDQRHKYMTFLQDNLLADGEIFLQDASDDDTLLAVKDHQLPFALRGKADLVLVDSASKQHKEILAGLQMALMVRKDFQPHHDAQIIGQLTSVGMKVPSNAAPMALLTDLNNQWHFYWFEDPRVLNHVLYKWPSNAKKFMNCVLPMPADFIIRVPEFEDYVRVASLAQSIVSDLF